MGLIDRSINFEAEADSWEGPTVVDPETILESLEAMGDRLALAAERGEEVLIATGHPVGMVLAVHGDRPRAGARGAKLLRPIEGVRWRELGRTRAIRYLHGVGVLTDRASSYHTHSPDPMRRMLEEATPDLVLGRPRLRRRRHRGRHRDRLRHRRERPRPGRGEARGPHERRRDHGRQRHAGVLLALLPGHPQPLPQLTRAA